MHSMAAVEAPLHPSRKPDAPGIDGAQGLEVGPKRARPLNSGASHMNDAFQKFLRQPGSGFFSRPSQALSARFVNRRIRNRTHGGVGGRRGRPASYPMAPIIGATGPPHPAIGRSDHPLAVRTGCLIRLLPRGDTDPAARSGGGRRCLLDSDQGLARPGSLNPPIRSRR